MQGKLQARLPLRSPLFLSRLPLALWMCWLPFSSFRKPLSAADYLRWLVLCSTANRALQTNNPPSSQSPGCRQRTTGQAARKRGGQPCSKAARQPGRQTARQPGSQLPGRLRLARTMTLSCRRFSSWEPQCSAARVHTVLCVGVLTESVIQCVVYCLLWSRVLGWNSWRSWHLGLKLLSPLFSNLGVVSVSCLVFSICIVGYAS